MAEAGKLARIAAERAVDVCRGLSLGDRAAGLLSEQATPATYLDRLIAEACYAEAIQFLAHALPVRQAVWWACLCARNAPPGNAGAALEAAEAWVLKPAEESRRKAGAAGEAAGTAAPGGWCALAAFWSGPDIAPEGTPAPAAAAVAAAVIASCVQAPAAEIEAAFQRALAQGLDVAAGGTGKPKGA